MKHLSAPQQVELTRWKEKIEASIKEAMDAVAVVNDKIAAYNDLLKEMEQWANVIYNQMTEFSDQQDEDWLESEDGQAFEEWRGTWEEVTCYPLEKIEDLDFDNPLADLTNEP